MLRIDWIVEGNWGTSRKYTLTWEEHVNILNGKNNILYFEWSKL